jgi:hypothetical protein
MHHFQVFDQDAFESYFKFCFVRNPWDRLVSAFHFLKAGGRNEQDRRWAQEYLADLSDFSAFMESMRSPGFAAVVLKQQHFWPQYHYVCGPRGQIMVDFLGRFERIEEDFQTAARIIGEELELPHYNIGNHKHYTAYYDQDRYQTAADLYQTDINLFQYEFPDEI